MIGPASTSRPIANTHSARSIASNHWRAVACRSRAGPRVIVVTIAGTNVSAVSVFERQRLRHTSQYGSPLRSATAAASAKLERTGATMTTTPRNTRTRRTVSKRVGASLSQRIPDAASSASLQLVAKSRITNEMSHPASSSINRWAGNAASGYTHQCRGGVSSNAAVRIALGGQSIEGVDVGTRSASPTTAPTSYAAQMAEAHTAIRKLEPPKACRAARERLVGKALNAPAISDEKMLMPAASAVAVRPVGRRGGMRSPGRQNDLAQSLSFGPVCARLTETMGGNYHYLPCFNGGVGWWVNAGLDRRAGRKARQ